MFYFSALTGVLTYWINHGAIESPEEILNLVNLRVEAKKNKDFARADQLRDEIKQHGFEVIDTKAGPVVKKI